jgi:hypothetical protein
MRRKNAKFLMVFIYSGQSVLILQAFSEVDMPVISEKKRKTPF